MPHGRQELHVHNVDKVPRLLQVVEAALLQGLTDDLVGGLRRVALV